MDIFRKAFDKDAKKVPETAETLYHKALDLINEHNYSEAILTLKTAIKIKPDFVPALNSLGKLLADQNKFFEAIIAYDRALMTDPGSIIAWNNRGIALIALHFYHEALRSFDEAIRVDERDSWSWYNRGTLLYNLKRYTESIDAFNHAVQEDPAYVNAWNNLGAANECLGNFHESLTAYEKSLEVNPGNNIANENKKRVLHKIQHQSESPLQQSLESSRETRQPKVENSELIDKYCYYGVSFARKEKHREAIEYFDKALEIDETCPEALFNKALCLAYIGCNDHAVACFKKFLAAAPPAMASEVERVKKFLELIKA